MTIAELILEHDSIVPSVVQRETKLRWINTLASMIQTEVWRVDPEDVIQYTDYSDVLLPIPAAYEGIWFSWLKAMTYRTMEENDFYNAAQVEFDNMYRSYLRWYCNRYHPAYRKRIRLSYNSPLNGVMKDLPPCSMVTGVTVVVTLGSSGTLTISDGSSAVKTIDLSSSGTHRIKVPLTVTLSASTTGTSTFTLEAGLYLKGDDGS